MEELSAAIEPCDYTQALALQQGSLEIAWLLVQQHRQYQAQYPDGNVERYSSEQALLLEI